MSEATSEGGGACQDVRFLCYVTQGDGDNLSRNLHFSRKYSGDLCAEIGNFRSTKFLKFNKIFVLTLIEKIKINS